MGILFYAFIFLFGLCVGSFLNVLICRLGSENKKGIGGRSHCPKCGHQLSWLDLVPVLSFILLRGKCRYCQKSISIQYPIMELATGVLFVFIFINLSTSDVVPTSDVITLIYFLFIASCLIVIFVSDLKYFIIPDEIIIGGVIGTLLYKLFGILDLGFVSDFGFRISDLKILLNPILSGFSALVFFLAIVLITKGKGMGLGDVKLAFLMGLILGWPNILVALLLAFIFGALVGLSLIVFSRVPFETPFLTGRAKFTPTHRQAWGMKSEMPFGTFLCASTFLVLIFGGNLSSLFFGAFLF